MMPIASTSRHDHGGPDELGQRDPGDPAGAVDAARARRAGRCRTSQAQIRSPSARKKYVENRTMKKPATTCPTAVPTSVTWLSTPPSPVLLGDRVLGLLDVVVDLRVAGVERPVAQPVPDLAEALDDLVGEVARRRCATCWPAKVSSSGDERRGRRARPGSPAEPARHPDPTPAGRTSGLTSAVISSATTSGRVITAKKREHPAAIEVAGGGDDQEPPGPGGGEVDAPRHLGAGEVGRAGGDRLGLGAGARRGSAPTGGRAARPAARRPRRARGGSIRGEATAAARDAPRRSAGRRRPRRGPSLVAHADRLPSADEPHDQPVRRLRVRLGEQPGGGQHVVVVDDHPRVRAAAASRPRRRRCCRRSTRSATPGRPLRSTPPEPTSRSTSRRSLPVRSTTRPSGLDHDPASGRRAGAARARPRRRRSPRRRRASASSSGRKPGSSCAAARGRVGQVDAPAASTVETADQRMPRSPSTVRVTGVVATTSRARPPVLGVELDDAVHVGGRAADVDDDHVAGAGPLGVEAAGEQLDAGEHDVRASRRGPSR